MIHLDTLLTYLAVLIVLLLIPGPAVLLVLARGASGGRSVGIATGLGVAVGDLGHTLMATAGMSAVMMTSALAFNVVKFAGAGYLIYLGMRALLERSNALEMPKTSPIGVQRAFRQAILAELLNPKTALFFLAFLPQFVHPQQGPALLQFAELGLIFVFMSALYTSLVALAAGSFGAWLGCHPGIGRWRGKFVGVIYLSLGIRLAAQQR